MVTNDSLFYDQSHLIQTGIAFSRWLQRWLYRFEQQLLQSINMNLVSPVKLNCIFKANML